MPTKKQLQRVASLLKKLASSLSKTLAEEPVTANGWRSAVLDVRWDPDGGAFATKFVATMPGGSAKVLRESLDTIEPLNALRAIPAGVFGGRWHGLRLTVEPGGECHTEWNFDPDCILDQNFWDT
jgi:hypothetical protein